MIGETKVYVKVDPEGNNYVDDDAWDFAVVDEELEDVDPNFLKKTKNKNFINLRENNSRKFIYFFYFNC